MLSNKWLKEKKKDVSLAGLDKQSRKKMTKKQRDEYLAREEAKAPGAPRTPLSSRYA